MNTPGDSHRNQVWYDAAAESEPLQVAGSRPAHCEGLAPLTPRESIQIGCLIPGVLQQNKGCHRAVNAAVAGGLQSLNIAISSQQGSMLARIQYFRGQLDVVCPAGRAAPKIDWQDRMWDVEMEDVSGALEEVDVEMEDATRAEVDVEMEEVREEKNLQSLEKFRGGTFA
ncbi:hypothetical protein BESB_072130 [Besnoitia besnoiti]|uniref:Uncharacterized protein n=1 Tax=Besnoitia besnoiti TaxID=94643 RepID=A0A2A9MCM0_BESBE|nr:uncharacterized protein BESB_072130 [Besnoitia besnoiti]PFH34061.1 hypothetical protein BESB_072130 [Besnoitia besnoiti]